jgi:hypothetical protein
MIALERSLRLGALLVAASTILTPQEKNNGSKPPIRLEMLKQVTVLPQVPNSLGMVLTCDARSNIFFDARLRPEDDDDSIVKFDLKAEKQISLQLFAPELHNLVMNPQRFTVTKDGHLYVPAALMSGKDRGWYIVHFDEDGKFKSKTKLSGYFGVIHVGVFASGDFLIVGKNQLDKNLPKGYFTGIFDSSGRLQKLIEIKDDEKTTEMLQTKDSNYVKTVGPVTINRTVELGQIRSVDDGNVYLLRRSSPAVIHAINSGGEVVRAITVDGGDGMFPTDFEYSNGYFAVRMHNPDKPATGLIKVISAITGDEMGVLESSGIGAGFTCFEAPATVKMLAPEKDKLVLKTYGPAN